MRAVIDTNVLISGFISNKGFSVKVIDLWVTGQFEPVVCKEIIEEYSAVLIRGKFSVLGSIEERLDALTKLLCLEHVVFIEPQQDFDVIKDDPKDNLFLACALEGNCKFILSGDRHLLDLKEYTGIKIVDAKEFLSLI
ncbi:putative PIN family toxin of toxin-antitoxin system [Caldicoprobacter guelmensis]|uniref:putative toxin-antitoxin system toxin component, PIN family n=1 Tax=Caldicoprobacter guelmensis TaxID=1170224 RepID=UPI001957D83B|nr:putative toxin-antitoxin system toxin component, PIN family [Caldicoprobacter guelmensis]MBM7581960.1 putative PIN family toxin of toxin-antitoxin system [Caldicoprobacter guelmensis]